MIKLSNFHKISAEGECIVVIRVIPHLAKLLILSMISKAVVESRPVVGSSKNNKEGFDINSIPILVLFFSPPEIPLCKASPTYVSAHLAILIRDIISSAVCSGSSCPLN